MSKLKKNREFLHSNTTDSIFINFYFEFVPKPQKILRNHSLEIFNKMQ
ncbi:hypothetical protein LEP1GSC116_3086 [Leptospira interrogans serovar Icterohaemorrhagiae str. Verdun HP]|uniref:SLEI domain protein, PF07620 family n=1 Tax=Leptospira interrogans serovar Icterohaemorrhagiae str. Verdun HP TaxID=1049910 RepID=M6RIA3_LEPIR|nr:hypothetical protein LEP1GSC053_0329 [Leptospira interrogans serovar Muenchen str. Brem 129]EMO05491.1 hypothetical protein LEP1GSC116_3086 [Leptospira interrogans serovar Icterohaemorrhagiae str. Verdun HP]